MWKPGTAVTIAANNTPQLLVGSTPIGHIKAIRIMGDPGNSGPIYWGDFTLSITATPKTGVVGWIPKPTTSTNPSDQATEVDAMNGINADAIYIAGTQNDVVLWSYIQQ